MKIKTIVDGKARTYIIFDTCTQDLVFMYERVGSGFGLYSISEYELVGEWMVKLAQYKSEDGVIKGLRQYIRETINQLETQLEEMGTK